jgi:hypothetical protein
LQWKVLKGNDPDLLVYNGTLLVPLGDKVFLFSFATEFNRPDERAFFYDFTKDSWRKLLVRSAEESGPIPSWKEKMHAASYGSSSVFWLRDQIFFFDGHNEEWDGPYLSPKWDEPRDYFRAPTFAVWTGMEWLFWENGKGYRLYP